MNKNNLRKMMCALVEECGYERVREELEQFGPGQRQRASAGSECAVPTGRRRARPNALTTVKSLALDDKEKANILTALAERYESKTFMPNVNHVRAFLDGEGEDVSRIKSRQQVTSAVFRRLARWDTSKLRDLDASGVYGPPKSFSVVAEAIEDVGRRKRLAIEATARREGNVRP